MLGFRGHFATKSRRYSVTLGAAAPRPPTRPGPHRRRQPRRAAPSTCADLEADLLADDDDETTLVIGHWAYAGTGWDTDGETALANAAAARAREYAKEKAEQEAHEPGSE